MTSGSCRQLLGKEVSTAMANLLLVPPGGSFAGAAGLTKLSRMTRSHPFWKYPVCSSGLGPAPFWA